MARSAPGRCRDDASRLTVSSKLQAVAVGVHQRQPVLLHEGCEAAFDDSDEVRVLLFHFRGAVAFRPEFGGHDLIGRNDEYPIDVSATR